MMTIGTEHEYSINDGQFNAQPVSDYIIKHICGEFESEIPFGDVKLSKELQKTVIEFIPDHPVPGTDLRLLENQLVNGIRKFYDTFGDRFKLLGLGMHPKLTLNKTMVWDHDETEYYAAYNRLFNIRQHGWLNIQALQVNISYASERDMVIKYNQIRQMLPYLIAVTASSPIVEGNRNGIADNRLLYYRENQKEIPLICNRIIPEKIQTLADYRATQDQVFKELRARDADILCGEWVNSSGLIVRFSRPCIEIKALDEQESIHSDMAVCAFIQALLRCKELPVPDEHDLILFNSEQAILNGTQTLYTDLDELYRLAWEHATLIERMYLPVIENRINKGCLAEVIGGKYDHGENLNVILKDMSDCLRDNTSYLV